MIPHEHNQSRIRHVNSNGITHPPLPIHIRRNHPNQVPFPSIDNPTPALLRDLDDDLPLDAVRLELRKGLGDVLILEDLINDSLDLAVGHPADNAREVLGDVLGHDEQPLAVATAEETGQQGASGGVAHAAEGHVGADLDEDACGHQEIVGGLVEVAGRGADIVDDKLELAVGRKLAQTRANILGLVVDNLVGAETAAEVSVGAGAGGDDVAAERLGDLDAEGSSAAGATVDEDAVAGALDDMRRDALQGGGGGGADARGLVEADALGHVGQRPARHRHVLAEGAEALEGEASEDAVADLVLLLPLGVVEAVRQTGDDAREVEARHGGQGDDGAHGQAGLGELGVDGVQGRVVHAHQHLVL